MPPQGSRKKKALLIGINYTGSKAELNGCHADVENVGRFLSDHGYPASPRSRVVLRDDLDGQYYPTGVNMLAAMDWLISEPHTTCFFHYSGHGGQVRDTDDNRPTGMDDTIVPVDYERRGQITADLLHEHLVTNLAPGSTLFVVLDCCHSGSALELPFVYKSDDNGNISLFDNLRQGVKILSNAQHLIQGGLSLNSIDNARQLVSDTSSFFRSFGGGGEGSRRGIGGLGGDDDDDGYLHHDTSFAEAEERSNEQKLVTMFSGCADEQTSADATISGKPSGAMSWALLNTIRADSTPTYEEVLISTRKVLRDSNYDQVPQLSMGVKMDLDRPLMI